MTGTPPKVLHVFPYRFDVSGGHSNAIKLFASSQITAGLRVFALSPSIEGEASAAASQQWAPGVPRDTLMEADYRKDVGVTADKLVNRFDLHPASTVVHFHGMNRDLARIARTFQGRGFATAITSHGIFNIRGLLSFVRKAVAANLFMPCTRKMDGLHFLTKSESGGRSWLLPFWSGQLLIQMTPVALPPPPRGASAEISAAPRAQEGKKVILYMGRLDVRTKGLDVLILAFDRAKMSGWELLFAGPDWKGGKEHLQNLAEKAGCTRAVSFLGELRHEEKWNILRKADLFALPSRWEAFSIAAMEAALCGKPLLLSRNTRLSAEVDDSLCLKIEPSVSSIAETLAQVAADPVLLATRGDAVRRWAEKNLDAELAGRNFRNFYEEIISKRSRARAKQHRN